MRARPLPIASTVPNDLRYFGPVMDVRMVTTFFVSKPRSVLYSAANERISRADPANRITARPVSLTTSAARAVFAHNPAPDRPLPSLRIEPRSTRELYSAGARPKTIPVVHETTS